MLNEKYRSKWEDLAELDPKWAILTEADKKYNKWDDKEFFETSENEIKNFLTEVEKLGIKIKFGRALDFGCGIGRVTRALSGYFEEVYGVDISEKMIAIAKGLHKENKKLIFLQNSRPDLSCFKNDTFDLIYSVITLQHIPDRKVIKGYLMESLRILNPDALLYFQLPAVADYSWFKSASLIIRGHIYSLFVKCGLPKEFCFYRLGLAPFIHMNYMPSEEVAGLFLGRATILGIYNDKSNNTRYLVQKKM